MALTDIERIERLERAFAHIARATRNTHFQTAMDDPDVAEIAILHRGPGDIVEANRRHAAAKAIFTAAAEAEDV